MSLKSFSITILFCLLPAVIFAESMSVAFSGADIRTAPSAAASKVIFTASRYYPLEVLSSEKEYYRVKDFRGRSGYIHKSLLSKVETVVVTADKANVRQGPGVDNPVIYQLSSGSSAKFLGKVDGWLEISSSKGKGWIADFLVWGH